MSQRLRSLSFAGQLGHMNLTFASSFPCQGTAILIRIVLNSKHVISLSQKLCTAVALCLCSGIICTSWLFSGVSQDTDLDLSTLQKGTRRALALCYGPEHTSDESSLLRGWKPAGQSCRLRLQASHYSCQPVTSSYFLTCHSIKTWRQGSAGKGSCH